MKKKLIDLTIEELEKICNTHTCLDCPCMVYSGMEEVCWKGLVENRIKEEIVVLENEKKVSISDEPNCNYLGTMPRK